MALALVSLLCGAPRADDGRAATIVKHAPRPRAAVKRAPDDPLRGLLNPAADGSRSLALEFGAVTLEYRVSRAADGGPGDLEIVLRDGRAEQAWRLPSAVFRRDGLANGGLLAGIVGPALAGPDAAPAEDIGERARELVGPRSWATLESIGRELAAAATAEGVTPDQVERGALRLAAGIREAQAAGLGEPASAAKAGECAGAVGAFLTMAGATGLCWTVNGLSAGTLSVACVLVGGSAVAGIFEIAENCGGHHGRSLQCSCAFPPDCMCCDVAAGEECTCWCPGQACCDWDESMPRDAPAGASKGVIR